MGPGERVAQRYVLDREAGSGAMGVVYAGKDLVTGTPVAVKVLRTRDGESVARFRREADVLARLRQGEVVMYLSHGETPDGAAFLVMEWLEGETLKDRLARGPLSALDAVDVAVGIATALGAAHALGVVHRDIKPGNVFLVDRSPGRVKVLDFGVARLRAEGPTLTDTGAMVGTPAYMSPEQARGERDLDGRSDLFSLGSLLHSCLSGRAPFAAEDAAATLAAIASRDAPSLDTYPRLARLVSALLQKSPAARPADARAVREELLAVRLELTGAAPKTPGATPASRASEASESNPSAGAGASGGGSASATASPDPSAPTAGASRSDGGGSSSVVRATLALGAVALAVGGAAVGYFVGHAPPAPPRPEPAVASAMQAASSPASAAAPSASVAAPPERAPAIVLSVNDHVPSPPWKTFTDPDKQIEFGLPCDPVVSTSESEGNARMHYLAATCVSNRGMMFFQSSVVGDMNVSCAANVAGMSSQVVTSMNCRVQSTETFKRGRFEGSKMKLSCLPNVSGVFVGLCADRTSTDRLVLAFSVQSTDEQALEEDVKMLHDSIQSTDQRP